MTTIPHPVSRDPRVCATISLERCPRCREKVLVKLPGEIVIRNAILRVDSPSGDVSLKCPRCRTWVDVPLRYVG
jgi:DNA-directed RNA polymerase subunit RPC12/RpoP